MNAIMNWAMHLWMLLSACRDQKIQGLSPTFTPRMTDTTPGSNRKPTKFIRAIHSSESSIRIRIQHCKTARRMRESHVW